MNKKQSRKVCSALSDLLTSMAKHAVEENEYSLDKHINAVAVYVKVCDGIEPDNWISSGKEELARLRDVRRGVGVRALRRFQSRSGRRRY